MSLPHAILTALLERPSSGLELTRRFDMSIGYFWSATHQQIYRELGRLETRGHIRALPAEQPARGQKKAYEVLPAGRAELARWTAEAQDPAAARHAAAAAARRGRRRHRRHRGRSAPPSHPARTAVGGVPGDRGAGLRPGPGRRPGPAAPSDPAGGHRPGDLLDGMAHPRPGGVRPAAGRVPPGGRVAPVRAGPAGRVRGGAGGGRGGAGTTRRRPPRSSPGPRRPPG